MWFAVRKDNEYRHKLGVFVGIFPKTYIDEVEDDDIVEYIATLRKRNLSTRTLANYCLTLSAFFRRNGFPNKVPGRLVPRATEKVVQAYRRTELQTLFAAADLEERILFQFFLGLGMREQEVMYAAWPDIDFERALFHVQEKPDFGFVIKDKEERYIPIPSALLAALGERYRRRNHGCWIFPTDRGQPDGHFLRRLQKIAHRAGLNSGNARRKEGNLVLIFRAAGGPASVNFGGHSQPFITKVAFQLGL